MERPARTVPSDIEVRVSDSETLSGAAHKSFTEAVRRYADNLLDEMSLQEWEHRDGASTDTAYTARHVANAVRILAIRGGMSRGRIPFYRSARIASVLTTLLSGASFGLMSLSPLWAIPGGLLALVAAGVRLVAWCHFPRGPRRC